MDPNRASAADCVRAGGYDVFLGDGAWESWEIAAKLPDEPGCHGHIFARAMAPYGGHPSWELRPWARVSVGDSVPDNLGGDEEPGLATGVVAVTGIARAGPFVLAVEPELEGGVVPGIDGSVRLATLYGAARWRGLSAGFGRRDRWLGPGRHASLLLSDNARPPWLGTATVEGRLPGWSDRLGRLRVELGAGWLDQDRGDVERPGLLLLDLRWLPVPWVEIGATRLSIFGGVGRPAVDVGQLLLPTEPHVYEDPDQQLPDQNELASLDFRVSLPIRRWTGLPVDFVEGWWQYGGEDVIARNLGPVPYPSLAGVGNLYGVAVQVRPITMTFEYTRLLDDYFRWYVGHRVYHDGFTQAGRFMGSFGGTDSETAFGAVAVEGEPGRVRGWVDWTRRVGVVQAQNDRLFALMTEEKRIRLGVDAGWRLPKEGWIVAGYSYDRTTGEGFVPGALGSHHRVYVGVEPAVGFLAISRAHP